MQNEIVDGDMVEEGSPVVPTAGFIDIAVCSSATIPPPPPSPPPPPPSPTTQQLVASLSPSTPVVDAVLPHPSPPQLLPTPPPAVDAALPPPPHVMDAVLQIPAPPVIDADRPPLLVADAALQLPPPPVLDPDQPLPPPQPVMDAALQLPPPPALDVDRQLQPPPPPPPPSVMDAASQIPPPPVLDADPPPPPPPPVMDADRPRSVTGNQSHRPVPSSRYESQKRRDWKTFNKYLKNQSPPVSVSQCNCSHVLEFLRYLDQFGKTKVHVVGCVYFGQLSAPDPRCSCPFKQAWGSLDSVIGRLRAAYVEHFGVSHINPFGSRAIGFYLRQVKECQAKARGVSFDKKRKIKANVEANASKRQAI